MRNVKKSVCLSVVAGLIAVAGVEARPRLRLPLTSHYGGHNIVEWQRAWSQWALGSSSNPIASGLCGEAIDGLFFLSAASEPGATFECDVPPGSRLLVTPALVFFESPTFGETDEEIIALTRQTWDEQFVASSVTVDGHTVEVEAATRDAGAYTIEAEPGSFYVDVIGFDPGAVRLASIGQFVILRPLSPGDHEIVASVTVDVGTGEMLTLDATFILHVGAPAPPPSTDR